MGRVIFKNGNQAAFLKELKFSYSLSTDQIADLCSVSPRTFRDWLRGKYSISEKALKILSNKLSFSLPDSIEIIEDYWYVTKGARNGALRRMELYGPPGTPEGRIKGGINSQFRRKQDPDKYKLLGCVIRKKFTIEQDSVDLAEAAGIILGDGGITDNQLGVYLSSLVDRPYSQFVASLFEKVFGERANFKKRISCNVICLTISGLGLVEELERWGFRRGNKVLHQVDFPLWIWKDIKFQKACVRGLMDTDGGCYFHLHKSNGLIYRNFGMCFTSLSLPIVQSVAKVLKSLGIKFSFARNKTQVYIYSFKEIQKYFNLIGTHNQKNTEKFNYYLNQKSHRVSENNTIGGMQERFNWQSWKDCVGVTPP